MSKEDVLTEFEKICNKEEYSRAENGNFLLEDILQNARNLVNIDRDGLIGALRNWLELRKVGRTEYAMSIAEDLKLKELKPDIEAVRNDIILRRYYPVADTYWTDRALKALE